MSLCDIKVRKPSGRSGWCQGGVFRKDYKNANHADEERRTEQGKAGPFVLGEIHVRAVIVQGVYKAEGRVWVSWMRIEVAEEQK